MDHWTNYRLATSKSNKTKQSKAVQKQAYLLKKLKLDDISEKQARPKPTSHRQRKKKISKAKVNGQNNTLLTLFF